MVGNVVVALQKGYMLTNVEVWKNTGIAVALLSSFLSATFGIATKLGWIPEGIDEETVSQIAYALVTLVGIFLGYVQVATTEKVGFKHNDAASSVHVTAQPVVPAATKDNADRGRDDNKSASERGRSTWLDG